jgi:Glycosyltransferase
MVSFISKEKMKKKIAIIVNEVSTLLHFRKELVLDLVKEGYEVFCLAEGYEPSTKEIIVSWGAKPVEHNLKRSNLNPLADIVEVFKLRKALKEIAPDIVLTCFVKPVIFASLAAKLAGIRKRVGMIEGLGYAFTPSTEKKGLKAKIIKFLQIQLYKIALPTLDKVLFLNPDDQRDLLIENNIKVKSTEILGGIGVNLDYYRYFEPKIKSDVSFIFLGRLLREKGIFEFLEAAKVVKKEKPNTQFLVLGQIDKQNPTAMSEEKLQEYIDANIIEYLGYVKNVPDYIEKVDVFVLPSYREGVPKSTQEAMAMGKVILTTDVPGCRETVVDGVNGFLVPLFSAEKLAEKMLELINKPILVRSMGIESRRIAEEKFDVRKVNKRIISILEE